VSLPTPRLSCLGLVAALLFGLGGVPVRSAPSSWQARVWQVEDEPDANIRGVVQTPDGFLWIATLDDLLRFDGFQFEKYRLSDFCAVTQKIRLLLEGRDGSLWLALENGPVVRLRPGKVSVFDTRQADSIPQTLVEDGDGAIWVSYNRGSVCRIQDSQVAQITAGLPGGAGAILATDRQGRVWFAKRGEIGLFRGDKFEVLLHRENMTTRLTAAADGGMWIFSGVHLLKYKDGGELLSCGSIEALNSQLRATVLLEGSDGSVWIGTQTGGLLHFDGTRFEGVPASHRTINSLLQDRDGNVWAATGAGLTRIRPRAITVEGADAGLPSEAVQSLCEDTTGVLWAGTKDAALVRRQEQGWQPVILPTDPAFEPVSRIAADPAGGIWVGTKRYKLHRFQNGAWTTWDQSDGLTAHTVTALYISRAGQAWVAGEQPTMLACVAAGKIRLLPLPAGTERIWSITEDAAGNIWAGGDSGTLLQIDPSGQVIPRNAKGSDRPTIRCLHATADGTLWLGTDGGGLGRLKDGRLSFITSAQGLAADHLSQIVTDGEGWFWFGAAGGIFKVRQDELNAAADGRLARLHCVRYGGQEGLTGLHPAPDDWDSALRTRDGRVWMPMGQALAIIDPHRMREDFSPPSVFITRIQMDDRGVAAYGGVVPASVPDLARPPAALRLPPGHRRLQFDFTALNFHAPEGIRFLFQLEGFDNRWIDAGTQRSASYSRLPPGRYVFRVKARGGDREWNERGAAVALVVTPFLWQRWWFQLAALAAFTLVVALVVRYVSHHRLRLKLRALQQRTALEEERSRIARDLHDDLGSRLTSMVLLNELAVQGRVPQEKAVTHAREISSAARSIIQSLDETVWAVNPRNDALPHLINYIGQYAANFLQLANVRCRLDLPDRPPDRTVSAEVRHNLFLTVKEALNNAVRHGRPSEVRLRVTVTDRELKLEVEDDGRGFARPPDDPSADGLRNMRGRMEAIGGQFQIESTPGVGTRVVLTFFWLQRP